MEVKLNDKQKTVHPVNIYTSLNGCFMKERTIRNIMNRIFFMQKYTIMAKYFHFHY